MRTAIQLLVIHLSAAVCLLALQVDAIGQTEASPATQTQQVRMSLIVTDRSQRRIQDLRAEEIQLTDDGQPRPITFFAKDERPLRYTIALDTSGSLHRLLPTCISIASALIQNNRANDETMLIRFVSSDKIETVHDFTTDKSKLLDSLKLMRAEGGQTAIIDAVHLSVQATASQKGDGTESRRVLVLISDGEDRASYYTEDHLVKLLREKDVQIFIIGVMSQLSKEEGLIRLSPRAKAEKLLKRLAEETGGQVFFAEDLPQLVEAAKHVNTNLDSQYIIGFERQNKPGEKGFRKVKISIARPPEKLVAITRPSYWIGPKEPDPVSSDKKTKDKK
jgi:Ca-activated chloride channel family protein